MILCENRFVSKRDANPHPVREILIYKASSLHALPTSVGSMQEKINGIKRHIAVDTLGLLLAVENYRRLNRNYECWEETSEAVVKMAMILVMLRRLA